MSESERERQLRLQSQKEFRVQFLVKETGIAEDSARELIELIGLDVGSLVREARFLMKEYAATLRDRSKA